MTTERNVLIEPDELESLRDREGLLIVDLCKREVHLQGHVPTAVHLEYRALIGGEKPAPGLLPPPDRLAETLSLIGLTPDHTVIAYDDEGGGKACRFLWTLDVIGHQRFGLLNGGIHAWANEGHPLSGEVAAPSRTRYPVTYRDHGAATKQDILAHLDDPSWVLLDARTPEEFLGATVRAARGGHIPGAVNLNWLDTLDRERNLRLLPDAPLRAMVTARGITPDKEVVAYCQTHHRSAHSYVMLKHLGYPRVRGYPGSWSEWGNSIDTPIETQ